MEIIDIVMNLFTPAGYVTMIKVMAISIEFIYVFYSFLVTRQIKNMNSSLHTQLAPMFSSMALGQFIVSIFIIIITISLN